MSFKRFNISFCQILIKKKCLRYPNEYPMNKMNMKKYYMFIFKKIFFINLQIYFYCFILDLKKNEMTFKEKRLLSNIIKKNYIEKRQNCQKEINLYNIYFN